MIVISKLRIFLCIGEECAGQINYIVFNEPVNEAKNYFHLIIDPFFSQLFFFCVLIFLYRKVSQMEETKSRFVIKSIINQSELFQHLRYYLRCS